MKKTMYFDSLSIGLAMFSMFFGAGNIIFPLALGQFSGELNFFAISGLILTAVIMPFAGVFAMILYEGNYKEFFGRVGKIPGFLLALFVVTLLGPLGSGPRCIALTYTAIKSGIPSLSPILFSAIACFIIFLCTFQKKRILNLLGLVLTPLLLLALGLIVALGLWTGTAALAQDHSPQQIFIYGLLEGYNTMDLLAAFFFSSSILALLKDRFAEKNEQGKCRLKLCVQASVIGGLLLALVYIGFSYIAAFHASSLEGLGKDELLSALTLKLAGPYAAILVGTTIALACLTTAIALLTVFTDFIQKEVLQEKISYEITLIGSLFLTFLVSTLEFTGISAFLSPLLQICYPVLIVLTFVNIFYKLRVKKSSLATQ